MMVRDCQGKLEGFIMPTDITLDFSAAIPGTLLDQDGEGIGFTSVQANSIGNAYDLSRIALNTSASSLVLTATQGSNASENTLKNAVQVDIDAKTQPFTVSSRLQGPFTNLTTAAQQGGIFLGPDQDNYVKLAIINSNTNGLGLQFFAEQNGVSASVGGGSSPQITGLDWESINTLDLFLKGNPTTGVITAAYRINSDTATPREFNQQFTPSVAATFFADAATAHAGILAFTKDAADTTVTFDNFSVKSSDSPSPDFTEISWNTLTPSPLARSEAQKAVVDGKMYVFGGYTNTLIPDSTRVDVYDPNKNAWTRVSDMPIATTHAGTAVDGKDIYIAGGVLGTADGKLLTASQNVWKYNVETDAWSSMPKLPQARGAGELSVVNGKLHFFGGTGFDRFEAKGDHWVLPLDSNTSWQPATPLPNPRNHLADAVIDGKIYAIGGQHGHNDNLVTQNSVHMWNPANPNTWTAVASLPKPVSHIAGATFVMGNRIIVAGGEVDHGGSVSDVTAYNLLTNTWTSLTPLPAPRHSGLAGSIGNQIFYTTGSFKGFQSTTYKGVPIR